MKVVAMMLLAGLVWGQAPDNSPVTGITTLRIRGGGPNDQQTANLVKWVSPTFDMAIWAYLFHNTPLPTAYLENGRCAVCKRLNLKSTVRMNDGAACTLAVCMDVSYFNENGVYVQVPRQPCNTCTSWGECSNGHKVVSSYRSF